MKKLTKLLGVLTLSIVAMVLFTVTSFAADSDNGRWIAAWGTGPTDVSLKGYNNIAFVGKDMSARTIITPTANGSKIRVRLSNYYGSTDLTLNSVTVADCVQADDIDPSKATSEIVFDSLKQVTFNGKTFVTIPVGKEVYSDPISFNVRALKNIAISMYIKNPATIRTMGLSGGTTYLSLQGDMTNEVSFGISSSLNFNIPLAYSFIRVVPCLAGIDVLSDNNGYAVAVVGDSTFTNEFPLYLSQKINSYGVTNVGVMGKAIIGNMLGGIEESLGSNLYGKRLTERFGQDVQAQSRIKYVIVKIGGNDILHPVCGEDADESKQPTSDDLIGYFKEICKQGHDMGAKVILCTITQWKGTTRDYFGAGASYVRTEEEFKHDWKIAQEVNAWIKDPANKYHDGYVDFVGISADPKDPASFDPNYTSDFIHPNSTLQKIWADSFPMSLIGVSKTVGTIKLPVSSKTVYLGEEYTLKVKSIIPSDAKNKAVKWTVSDESVLQIVSQNSNSIKVKALKNGTAKITATAADGYGATATCKITAKTHVSKVTLSKSSVSLYTRETTRLTATVSPSSASDKSLVWSTSNKNVVAVSQKGTIKGVSAGTATITCTSVDGSKKATCKVTVKKAVDVTGLVVNSSGRKIYKGKTYQLTATVLPTNATFKTVTWTSENNKIATVSDTGLVKAVSTGTTYIVCRSTDNTTRYVRVKIVVLSKATGVSISPKSVKMVRDAGKQLTAVFTPSDATNRNVKWSSSDKTIVGVSNTGYLTAYAPGTATITCKTEDGGFTSKITVTVVESVKVKKVTLNRKTATMNVGDKIVLKATVSPENANFKTLKWTSSNTKIARVTKYGTVGAYAKGKATITCTNEYGKVSAKCVITVNPVAPSSVKLSKTNVSVTVGKTYKLSATVNPSYAENKQVKWSSSNTKIATVDSNGKITTKKVGTVKITCKTVSGGKTATCTVKVVPIKVSQVKLNKTSITLSYTKSYTLVPTVSPSNASNKKVTWASSNTKVATVDKNGKVTAKGVGTATITCKPADGGKGKAATCKVTVIKNNVTGIQVSDKTVRLKAGQSYRILGKVSPSNASDKRIEWLSLNTDVATVSSNGTVKAKKAGRAIIVAKSKDGGYRATCIVTVTR